jgi:hypothetical protein
MKCPRGNENPNNNYWPAMKSSHGNAQGAMKILTIITGLQ